MFGYGSLIWRPDFPFIERRRARLAGYARRFWQGSHDHRGVPHAPGRVVTLIELPDAECDGVAFRLSADVLDDVLAALDHREKNGYQRRASTMTLFEQDVGEAPALTQAPPAHRSSGGTSEPPAAAAHDVGVTRPGSIPARAPHSPHLLVQGWVYVAVPNNFAWLGDAPLADMAAQIVQARGPSGANVDYLLQLQSALHARDYRDTHVEELATAARALLAARPRNA